MDLGIWGFITCYFAGSSLLTIKQHRNSACLVSRSSNSNIDHEEVPCESQPFHASRVAAGEGEDLIGSGDSSSEARLHEVTRHSSHHVSTVTPKSV